MLQAARENREEDVTLWLEKRAQPLYEEAGWNALLWAACNGNETIVRSLIKHNACAPYLTSKGGAEGDGAGDKGGEEEYDPFVKPKDAGKVGRYTPLHWASYHGHYKVVWILLKEGLSPLEIDMYGNTAIHQAAAAGHLNVLECFLSRGIDVTIANARGHSPMELATEPETKKLISKATKTLKCENCASKFDFKNVRYYCRQSNKFYCKDCSITKWVYEDWDSNEMERPVCRSLVIDKKIRDHENDLSGALESNDFKELDIALKSCAGIDIEVKLRKKAEI